MCAAVTFQPENLHVTSNLTKMKDGRKLVVAKKEKKMWKGKGANVKKEEEKFITNFYCTEEKA